VNAIPAIVAARPGTLSTLELPPLIGRKPYRPEAFVSRLAGGG
jgi:hypothetical protein